MDRSLRVRVTAFELQEHRSVCGMEKDPVEAQLKASLKLEKDSPVGGNCAVLSYGPAVQTLD